MMNSDKLQSIAETVLLYFILYILFTIWNSYEVTDCGFIACPITQFSAVTDARSNTFMPEKVFKTKF